MDIKLTDPEYQVIRERFLSEVVNEEEYSLPPVTRYTAVLAALMGLGSVELFSELVPDAVKAGLSPVAVREIVYQGTDYLGLGRALPYLKALNEVFVKEGVPLPLPMQGTTTEENRLEKGIAAQVEIFGEHMNEAWKQSHINRYLASNCFGDYYTRNGLSLKDREMITFCYLMAQGGCEMQLTAHAKGNMNLGNDAHFLTAVVTQCLPYIGYPRSLNAIACIKKAAE